MMTITFYLSNYCIFSSKPQSSWELAFDANHSTQIRWSLRGFTLNIKLSSET